MLSSRLLTPTVPTCWASAPEIAPGYYRLVLNTTSAPDVRIKATATIYATALTTNMVIIGLRDLSAFNPYLDINVIAVTVV